MAPPPLPTRRGGIADILLARTVRRLNRLIRPDATLVLGDLLEDAHAEDAEERLRRLRSILEELQSPYLAIPGNHDGQGKLFQRVFPRPKEWVDICGVRFVPFLDPQTPGFNADRPARDVDRIRMARAGYGGRLVALQHVPLFPPPLSLAPYNYTNASGIIEIMQAAGVSLCLSGHHHPGTRVAEADGIVFVNAPALCEGHFPFLEITLEGRRKPEIRRHELAMPSEWQLFDNHVHTPLAYCNENMSVERSLELARDFGLAGVSFTEHSGQLYFDRTGYWDRRCLREGMGSANAADNRMTEYLDLKRLHESEFSRFGLEVDCDYRGKLLLRPEDRKHFSCILGALHALPSLTQEVPPGKAVQDEFLGLLEKLLAGRIDVLAHPFRVFSRSGWTPPEELFGPTAQLLKKHGTAAEINFHTNEPPVGYLRACLDRGVRFSFGSDAHHLSEIGDFADHVARLAEAGFDGDLQDVLVQDGGKIRV